MSDAKMFAERLFKTLNVFVATLPPSVRSSIGGVGYLQFRYRWQRVWYLRVQWIERFGIAVTNFPPQSLM